MVAMRCAVHLEMVLSLVVLPGYASRLDGVVLLSMWWWWYLVLVADHVFLLAFLPGDAILAFLVRGDAGRLVAGVDVLRWAVLPFPFSADLRCSRLAP